PHAREAIIQRASTNLHNLAHGHIGTLLGSAVVVDAGPIYFWLPFLTCLLVLAELQLHTIRLMVAFLVGHVGATLVVAVALAAAVEFGWLPVSIARANDVGMSYGALAVLGAMTATLPRRWRPAWVGWWIAAATIAAIVGADFTDVGHTVAVILGLLVSARLSRPVHWTPLRLFMLVNSTGFGFLVLAHHWWGMAATLVFGLLGALVAYTIAQFSAVRSSSPPPPLEDEDSVTGAQPVMTG
ncbi:MAG: rhomboid-like protein, partial [Mycobacterium sp.]